MIGVLFVRVEGSGNVLSLYYMETVTFPLMGIHLVDFPPGQWVGEMNSDIVET